MNAVADAPGIKFHEPEDPISVGILDGIEAELAKLYQSLQAHQGGLSVEQSSRRPSVESAIDDLIVWMANERGLSLNYQISTRRSLEGFATWIKKNFLRQNAVAFLGGLARLMESEGRPVRFKWETLKPGVYANLAQNGFIASFGGEASPWSGNSIPYLEHQVEDANSFVEYLTTRWLGRGWIGVSEKLTNAIVGKVTEAYINAFEHSHSPVGIFCCGQHFPRAGLLNISIVDFGIGIPTSVRQFKADEFKQMTLPASRCLEWAFQPGTSTKLGMGRGLGLDILRDFIAKNQGGLDIYSNEGVATMRLEKMQFYDLIRTSLDGTLINISLQCDESYYCFASELQ